MDANLHPRVVGLIERLRHIGETQLRELPVYNDALAVEGVGFRVIDDALVGVVITPWFMNAIHLPVQRVPIDWSDIGHKIEHRLPGGSFSFKRGGDEVVGHYDALSLHSPMTAFQSRKMARSEADRCRVRLFDPPRAATSTAQQPESPSRRAFLRGRASGA